LPANGTAGGILMGFKKSTIDVISWQEYRYRVLAMVKNQVDGFLWRVITVYASPYDETKAVLLDELDLVMGEWQGPSLIGVTLIW
jgi:hypothetical protein